MMELYAVLVMTFAAIFFVVMAAVLWSAWFPTTRCGKIMKNSPCAYNVCIKNKSHEGLCTTAGSQMFNGGGQK